jgi:hypothetical protein
MDKQEKVERARRQKIVSQVVFGVFFLAIGLLFSLDNLGVISVGHPLNYWPVLLIALSIAPLIAPKDSGDEVWGVFLLSGGTFFLLRHLDVIDWGWWDVWPLALILAGALLLVRSLAERKRPSERGVGSFENGGAR